MDRKIMDSMDLSSRLKDIFSENLGLKPSEVVDELRYGEIPQWDSIAHMALIAAIEETFDLMIDAEDVINMSSFAEAKLIVGKCLAQHA